MKLSLGTMQMDVFSGCLENDHWNINQHTPQHQTTKRPHRNNISSLKLGVDLQGTSTTSSVGFYLHFHCFIAYKFATQWGIRQRSDSSSSIRLVKNCS